MIYTKEIQIIIREYFKILYSTNLENLKEIDGFLDSAKPLKLNQEEDTNISTPITNEETKIITKKSSSLKKKVSRIRWLQRRLLPDIQRRSTISTIQKNRNRRSAPKLL